MDMVSSIFLWFCYSTLAASAVGLLVIAIQALFRRQMSPRMRHALWLIVLIRLLLPDFPNSPFSLFNALYLTSGVEQVDVGINPIAANEPKLQSLNNQELEPPKLQLNDSSQSYHPIPEAVSLQQTEPAPPVSASIYPIILQIVSAVWLAGAVAIFSYLVVYLWKLKNKRKTLRMVTDARIVSIMNDCKRKFGIKQHISLYTGDEMKSPHISGVVNPWIYIPEALGDQLNDAQLYHLFSHELAHYKRKDILWNMVGSFVLAIHWMNPFIWICIAKMKADRELACDAYALEVLGEDEAIPYGMTIIEFLKFYSANRNQPSLLYFNGPNNRYLVMRRITMIKSFRKGTYKLSAMAVLCVAVMSVMTLTNAAEPLAPNKYAESAEETLKEENAALSPNLTDRRENAVQTDAIELNIPKALPEKHRIEKMIDHEPNRTEAGPNESVAKVVKEAAAAKEEKAAPPPDRTANNRLEKAVKDAGFEFKVPDALPEAYRFEQVDLGTKEINGSKRTEAAMRFVQRNGENVTGKLEFFATNKGDDLKTVYENIEQSADKSGKWSIGVSSLQMKERYAMKVTVTSSQSEKRYYTWDDQGVQYQFQVTGNVSDQDIIKIVSNMKQPDADMYKRYGNDKHSSDGMN